MHYLDADEESREHPELVSIAGKVKKVIHRFLSGFESET